MKNALANIRFGVVCDGTKIPTWQKMIIQKLVTETDIELKLVMFEAPQITIGSGADSLQNPSDNQGGFWSIYYKYRIKKKSKALQIADIQALINNALKIQYDFDTATNGYTTLKEADIIKIENEKLDFIINFSSKKFTGKVVNTTRYGIWAYSFGHPTRFIGNPSCFWEIYNEVPITSAYLIRLTKAPDNVILLKEGHLKTEVLYFKNFDKIHFECTAWPLEVCMDIRNNRKIDINTFSTNKIGMAIMPPNNLQFLNFFYIQFKLTFKLVCKLFFYTDQWNIGLSNSPIHEFLNSDLNPEIKWFPNLPKARLMADAFGVYFKNDLYIIYEDLLFNQGKGKIGSFLFKNGSFTQNEIVIDEKFHMSYPFLIEHEGHLYCIPETYQANEVRLYKALEFPSKWKMEKVLIENYPGLDSTPFKYEGDWFLFSTNKSSGRHHHLNIHYAESIFGPWKAHPKNPVKTDIRSARPAGTVFQYNGEVFRPSMDYSEKIEGRIVINKILTLSRVDFKEEAHNIVDPYPNTYFSDKVHTLSKVGPYTLVDGAKELFVFSSFKVFKYKIKRVFARLKRKGGS